MKKILVLLPVLISLASLCQVRSTDLQAVSVSPVKITPRVGESLEIELVMRNNGPDVLLEKEGTAHVTINNKYLTVPTARNLKFDSEYWKIDKIKRSYKYGFAEVFLSTKGPVTAGEIAPLSFVVKARAAGEVTVSVSSSLSGRARSGDPDGSNQSVNFNISISK